MSREPYRQVLPDLALSIERYTPDVPDDGGWYLLRAGEQLGRYKTLKAAQVAWKGVVQETGWTPRERQVDAHQIRRREQMERWSRNRGG